MISFLVSVGIAIVLLFLALYILDKCDDSIFGIIFLLGFFLTAAVGLFLIPLTKPIYTSYEKVYNYKVLREDDAIVIDLTNSNFPDYSFKKFYSHKAFIMFSDSTELYIRKTKSFYKVIIDKDVVWSNPSEKVYHFN